MTDERPTLERLHGFLGIPFEEAQLTPRKRSTVVSAFEEGWKHNVRRPLIPERAAAWREELGSERITRLERRIGRLLRRVGYASAQPEGSVDAMASVAESLFLSRPLLLVLRLAHWSRIYLSYRLFGKIVG